MKHTHIRTTEDLERTADYIAELQAQRTTLLAALIAAKRCIRIWHGIHMEPETEEMLWGIYNKSSPEMNQINAVISETEASLSNLIPA